MSLTWIINVYKQIKIQTALPHHHHHKLKKLWKFVDIAEPSTNTHTRRSHFFTHKNTHEYHNFNSSTFPNSTGNNYRHHRRRAAIKLCEKWRTSKTIIWVDEREREQTVCPWFMLPSYFLTSLVKILNNSASCRQPSTNSFNVSSLSLLTSIFSNIIFARFRGESSADFVTSGPNIS